MQGELVQSRHGPVELSDEYIKKLSASSKRTLKQEEEEEEEEGVYFYDSKRAKPSLQSSSLQGFEPGRNLELSVHLKGTV